MLNRETDEKLTPMMEQYIKIHEQAPDALLFFRLGDFYEMFFDDAIIASKVCKLTLTGRNNGKDEHGNRQKAPMCGVPYHSVDSYIGMLVDAGYKVAICEQVSDPKLPQKLVDRQIVRILSSGTVIDDTILKEDKNNFLMCIYYDKLTYGIAYADISTGETFAHFINGENADEKFLNFLNSVSPSEILVNSILYKSSQLKQNAERILKKSLTPYASEYFSRPECENIIKEQFEAFSLKSLGIEDAPQTIKALGGLLLYLHMTQKNSLKHINHVQFVKPKQHMYLDYATLSNLELTQTIRGSEKKGSLLWVLDKAATPAGSRRIRNWINEPLTDKDEIIKRHDVLDELTSDIVLNEDIRELLKLIGDNQRIVSKISYGKINGRELIALKESIFLLPRLKKCLLKITSPYLKLLRDNIDDMSDMWELLDKAVDDECTANVNDGKLIKKGFDKEIDEYRELNDNVKQILADLLARERMSSGIKNLKFGNNKVFGYYFEVSKGNINNVPAHFIRRQTLTNGERYITEELKEIEEKVIKSQENLLSKEKQIYEMIINFLNNNISRLQSTAKILSEIDALCSFAKISHANNYVRPELNDDGIISISDGRHPVVEAIAKDQFIPNDTYLNGRDSRIMIITGPNMAGKSTYIRQVAIIALMNQIGCFVPCSQANLCIVDRIFTRVGASDDLSSGQSTFMVEMSEVANILKNATEKSLVILDEVGRGTSTADGLCIARAVTEYLFSLKCKTLFATHYHELIEMESIEGIVNYSITTKQTDTGIVFLHKIQRGGSDKSYGIDVAKLAGLPLSVTKRAQELLYSYESGPKRNKNKSRNDISEFPEVNLLNYAQLNAAKEIRDLPIDEMTPIEVMNFVAKLKKDLKIENE